MIKGKGIGEGTFQSVKTSKAPERMHVPYWGHRGDQRDEKRRSGGSSDMGWA